jgi:hypothetical protein
VLIRGSRYLQEQVQELQEYLALPASTIADLLRRCPRILAAGSAVWLANITTLLEVLQLTPQQVQAAVVAKPQLMRRQPDQLLQAARRLAQLLAQHPPWRQQLMQLSSRQLVVILRLDAAALWRLAYLVNAAQPGKLISDATLALNKAKWAEVHPQFARWMRRQQRQGEVAAKMPAPAAPPAAAGMEALQAPAASPAAAAGAAALQQIQQQQQQQQEQQQAQIRQVPQQVAQQLIGSRVVAAQAQSAPQRQGQQQQQQQQQPQQLLRPQQPAAWQQQRQEQQQLAAAGGRAEWQ